MKKQTFFLIDAWNNNKVVGEFNSMDEINTYLQGKEFTENWENTSDTFDEYLDGFYTIEWSRMQEAVRKYGKRKLEYWT